jgi:adenosylmethionine-8-amino-7-oxononanoate aminotransferase
MEGFGVIGRPLPGDGLAFSPPLIITREEIDLVLDGVTKALESITVELREEGLRQTV